MSLDRTCRTRRVWPKRSPATSRRWASPSNFHTAGWRTGYLKDEAVGKYPAWLLGWTCDWPGPDNFLNTAFFHFAGDKPNPEFAYGPPELKAAFDKGATAADEATAAAAWGEAQDILARDLPTVPIVHSKPPAAAPPRSRGSSALATSTSPCGASGSTSNLSRSRRIPGVFGPGDAVI